MTYGGAIHIVKVEDDFHEMERLKVRAEAADVAKSQVSFHHLLSFFNKKNHFSCYIYIRSVVWIDTFIG